MHGGGKGGGEIRRTEEMEDGRVCTFVSKTERDVREKREEGENRSNNWRNEIERIL